MKGIKNGNEGSTYICMPKYKKIAKMLWKIDPDRGLKGIKKALS